MPKLSTHGLANPSKSSLRKVVSYASLAFGAIVFVSLLVLLFFPDTHINGYLKKQIINEFTKAYPEYSIRIAAFITIYGKTSSNATI